MTSIRVEKPSAKRCRPDSRIPLHQKQKALWANSKNRNEPALAHYGSASLDGSLHTSSLQIQQRVAVQTNGHSSVNNGHLSRNSRNQKRGNGRPLGKIELKASSRQRQSDRRTPVGAWDRNGVALVQGSIGTTEVIGPIRQEALQFFPSSKIRPLPRQEISVVNVTRASAICYRMVSRVQ